MNRPRIELPPERRVVLGKPPVVPGGLALLASRARGYALKRGLAAFLYYSRVPGSASRYLDVYRRGERGVTLRISDHARVNGVHAHFELIALDGMSGFEQLQGWIENVAAKGQLAAEGLGL